MSEKQRDLKIRMRGDDVKNLQDVLVVNGFTIGDKPGFFGKETQRAVKELQKRLGLSVTGVVDAELFERLGTRATVHGQITQPNGNPISSARVRLVDKKLLAKDDITVREIETDASGNYEATYVPEPATSNDLLVQVLNSHDEVVATSPLIIDAAKKLTVDLVVNDKSYPDLTEFEQLNQRLQPFLNSADPAELDNDAVAYLAGKSRVNPINIAYLVQANRLAKATGVEAEAFYALLRANLPVSLPALLVQDQSTQKQALEKAAKANIINQKVADKAESVLKTLVALSIGDL